MSKNVRVIVALVVASGAVSAAFGQAPGDIIFTDELSDTINHLTAPGVWTPLVTFNDPSVRLAQITNIGNRWYVANGPRPVDDPSNASIFQIDNLFGVPSVSTLASGEPLQNPIGLKYHKATGQLITVQHVDSPINQPKKEGIFAIDPSSGAITEVFAQQNGAKPIYRDGYRLIADPNSDDFFVTCVNGGIFDGGPGQFNKGSTIWRLSIDPNTLEGTVSLLVDLSNVLADPLTFVRGITAIPGTSDLYIGDGFTQGIYKVSLDGSGDFSTISQIAAGIQDPWEIVYNPYTNKLVYGEQDISTISQMNLDGSGIELLATGVGARGIAIVPTPGGVALLTLAGLVSIRRRR
jgi:MYXO-CTERM domain-containing protein